MDKRLELTERQKKLVARLNTLAKEMSDAHIGIIYKEFGELWAYNKEQIEDTFFDEDCSEDDGDVRVKLADLEILNFPIGLNLTWGEDYYFGVRFK